MKLFPQLLTAAALSLSLPAFGAKDYGACVIRNSTANLPGWGAPNVGAGYVKYSFTGNLPDFPSAQAVCTDEIFLRLLADYCRTNDPSQAVQFGVALYPSRNRTAQAGTISGCAASGCQLYTCDSLR